MRNLPHKGTFPHSYSFVIKVRVHESIDIEHAMKDGAPNTGETAWKNFCRMRGEFPPEFSGYRRKEILFFCFGMFVRPSYLETLAAEVRERHNLSDMGVRTMLAIGDEHRTLCQEKGVRRMRLVSLAHKVSHLGLWHVPVLHQEDRTDCVTNAIALEPYDFGWSAEHVFGFERNAG